MKSNLKFMKMLKQVAVVTSALAILAISASADPIDKNRERSHHRTHSHYQAGLVGFSSNNAKQQTSEENDSYRPARSPGFDEYLR